MKRFYQYGVNKMALPRLFFANDSLCDVLSGVASILHHAPVVCVGQENSLLDIRPSLRVSVSLFLLQTAGTASQLRAAPRGSSRDEAKADF